MKRSSMLTVGLTAATLVGSAMLAPGPASAAQVGISIRLGGVGFSYNSGGYFDDYGCPGNYWDYPVYYCPVYYHGRWYRGPAYYRQRRGSTMFWVRGGWRRDEWRGPRPSDACSDRFGPPLDLYFYQSNGFRVRDTWWNSWGREHNDWYWRDNPDWRRNRTFGSQHNVGPGHEWDRDRNWQGTTHPWRGAQGQGTTGPTQFTAPTGGQGGSHSGSMGTGTTNQNPQNQGGGQGSDQGRHGDHTGQGSSNNPGATGQGGSHSGSMSTGPANQNSPQSQGGGQGTDQGRHKDTTGQGSSNNPGASGGQGSSNQNTGNDQGTANPDNSGKDKGAEKKKHGDDKGDHNPPDKGDASPH